MRYRAILDHADRFAIALMARTLKVSAVGLLRLACSTRERTPESQPRASYRDPHAARREPPHLRQPEHLAGAAGPRAQDRREARGAVDAPAWPSRQDGEEVAGDDGLLAPAGGGGERARSAICRHGT
jgi:hypothetical protein